MAIIDGETIPERAPEHIKRTRVLMAEYGASDLRTTAAHTSGDLAELCNRAQRVTSMPLASRVQCRAALLRLATQASDTYAAVTR